MSDIGLLAVLGIGALIVYGFYLAQKNANNPGNQPSGIPGIPNWLDPTYDIGTLLGGQGIGNPRAGTQTPVNNSIGISSVGTSSNNTPYVVLQSGGLSLNMAGFQQVYGPGAIVGPTGQTVQQLISSGTMTYADIADMIAMTGTLPQY